MQWFGVYPVRSRALAPPGPAHRRESNASSTKVTQEIQDVLVDLTSGNARSFNDDGLNNYRHSQPRQDSNKQGPNHLAQTGVISELDDSGGPSASPT